MKIIRNKLADMIDWVRAFVTQLHWAIGSTETAYDYAFTPFTNWVARKCAPYTDNDQWVAVGPHDDDMPKTKTGQRLVWFGHKVLSPVEQFLLRIDDKLRVPTPRLFFVEVVLSDVDSFAPNGIETYFVAAEDELHALRLLIYEFLRQNEFDYVLDIRRIDIMPAALKDGQAYGLLLSGQLAEVTSYGIESIADVCDRYGFDYADLESLSAAA